MDLCEDTRSQDDNSTINKVSAHTAKAQAGQGIVQECTLDNLARKMVSLCSETSLEKDLRDINIFERIYRQWLLHFQDAGCDTQPDFSGKTKRLQS